MAKEPFLGVPQGSVRVENPDGTYLGSYENHNLYDRKPPLEQPTIPGAYDNNREITNPRT